MKKPNQIINNIGLKILAVIFSVLLWLVSVNINDPVDRNVSRLRSSRGKSDSRGYKNFFQ